MRVVGKTLALDNDTFRLRGVTYGSFRARPDGALFPATDRLRADFAAIAAAGLNTVRTYTLPPVDLLEAAEEHGLFVLAGVHYDDWRSAQTADRRATLRVLDAGRRAVAETLDRCADRSTVLGVSIGNEVPADIVRVHGIGRVAHALGRLVDEVHAADPAMLVTYTNFPTTEYLDVPGQDFLTFNVFLEQPDALRRYLRHLNRLAGDRPLVLTELGLAEGVHGDATQAASLETQLQLVDETGCAGATVFAWTDEWAVADQPVQGWGFGLTDADRQPKLALDVVRRWAARPLHELRTEWPKVSVVVCAYNESARIRECLESLRRLDYPDAEVLVCDDGSTDDTLDIAKEYPFRILDLSHAGLSAARNAGVEAATGEIVAFLDADAMCTPDWLHHLVLSFDDANVVATGGPNLPVDDAPLAERAVALSPGAPVEVLVADDRAEHVPGCNMAFRRDALLGIGGFNPAYVSAGDDVDVCWKLLDRGGEIAFAPSATVFHHRRNSLRGYLRQQRGYGRAERMLTGAHPHRFNRLGQARWNGAIYGGVRLLPRILRPAVYHGYLGAAPFQVAAPARCSTMLAWIGLLLPLLVVPALLGVGLAVLSPWALVVSAAAAAVVIGYGTAIAVSVRPARHESRPWALRWLVALMHVAQPFLRLRGRLEARPLPPDEAIAPAGWTGDRLAWLDTLRERLSARGCRVRVGAPTASYDVTASVGPLVRARLTTAVLWHWTPVARCQVRVRPLGAFLLAAVAVAGLTLPAHWSWIVPTVVVVMVAAETTVLRRRVDAAVRDSARAASFSGGNS